MILRLFLTLAFLTLQAAWSQGAVTTYAGNGNPAFSGDGGPAAQASINRVVALATDASGNLYAAEELSNRVRKIDVNGVIDTLAGNGSPGFSGDGGPAAQAQLSVPLGVCVDPAQNVYINDTGNKRIRKVTPSGTITTIAGTGAAVHGGDGGPALSASFVNPIRCVVDRNSNLYIADQGAHRVRRIDPAGNITTYAGTGAPGFSGDGGPAAAAALSNPTALATDAAGNLYITDQVNHKIRRVDTGGAIQTVAFNGSSSYGGDGGPALSASAYFPGSVAVDGAGSLLIVDTLANRVRKVTGGTISTVAGNGAAGFSGDNGPALQAMFSGPFAIALDSRGNTFVGDIANNRIRKITGIAAGSSPVVTSAGVTNGASFQTGIAPGGIVTIFGTGLGAAAGQVIVPSAAAWPLQLSGISVTMDGVSVPIYRILNLNGQEQLSIQVPFSIAGKTSTAVVVTTPQGSSNAVAVPVLAAQPGIFILDSANAGAVHADGSIVTSARPAAAGETVVIYLTGLGTVSNSPAAGQPASLSVLSQTTVAPQVAIGGLSASVAFSGLTPGFIGLYQINAVVPNGVPAGNADLVIQANGVNSNKAAVPVR